MATIITNPQTRQELQRLGCLLDGRIDRPDLARVIARHLEAGPVVASEADIESMEVTVGHLVIDLIGFSDEQVIRASRGVLAATADGMVQMALTNGHWLCGGKAKHLVPVDGEICAVTVQTRFLTSDYSLYQQYVIDPLQFQVEVSLYKFRAATKLAIQRKPEVANEVADLLRRLEGIVQRELAPPPAPSTNQSTNKKRRR